MSRKKDILTVDFDNVTQGVGADFTDGDIVILRNVDELASKKSYLFEIVLIAFCEKGKVQMDINGTRCSVAVGDIVILPPKTIVENIMISPDIEFKAVGISYEAVQRNVHIGKDAWDILQYVTQNPVLHISQINFNLINCYHDLLALKLQNKNEIYYKEVMQSLYGCVYYELCSAILPLAKTMESSENSAHNVQICKRFFELLSSGEGNERSVSKIATKLCITPKYLSAAVKAATDKTALNWIHTYTMRMIEREMRYTDKTVKEIANDLHFSSLSFFGKFVKNHTGMSPTAYRKSFLIKE